MEERAMTTIKFKNFFMERTAYNIIKIVLHNNYEEQMDFNINLSSIGEMLKMNESNRKDIQHVLLRALNIEPYDVDQYSGSSWMQEPVNGDGLTFTITSTLDDAGTASDYRLVVKIKTQEKEGIYEMPVTKKHIHQMLSLVSPVFLLSYESE